jgi:methylmalonyl-CoA mutase
MEESHLGRVADPAGGAWYLDSLTDQMARAAWGGFQAIEAAGGIVKALESGLVAEAVAPPAPRRKPPSPTRAARSWASPSSPTPTTSRPRSRPDPAAFAVEVPDVRLPGPDSRCPPLTPIRFAAAFEGA